MFSIKDNIILYYIIQITGNNRRSKDHHEAIIT